MAIVYHYTRTALILNVWGSKHNMFIYTATVEANQAMKREIHTGVHLLRNDYLIKATVKNKYSEMNSFLIFFPDQSGK